MRTLKNIAVLLSGLIGALYLLNFGAGVFELIPGNLPIVGNLDEAGAAAMLIHCLTHFGRGRHKPQDQTPNASPRG